VQLTQDFIFQAWKPGCSAFQLQISPITLHVALEFTLHGCTSSKIFIFFSLYLISMHKTWFPKIVVPNPYEFPLFGLPFLLTLFPKLIVLNPHVPNNFRMWPLTLTHLHVSNDWIWEHSIKNWKVHIQIENLGKMVELIYMGNSPLNPSWPLS
jgi:hypothetical protein